MSDIAISVVNAPLRNLGIGEDEWRMSTLFTRGAISVIPPKGGSIGKTKGLMKWLSHWKLVSWLMIRAAWSLNI